MLSTVKAVLDLLANEEADPARVALLRKAGAALHKLKDSQPSPADAQASAEALLTHNPVQLFKDAALQHFKAKDYGASASAYTAAINTCYALEPSNTAVLAVLYANRGYCYASQGADCEASATLDYTTAVQLDPTYAKGWGRLAAIYEAADNLQYASAAIANALQHDPASVTFKDAQARIAAALASSTAFPARLLLPPALDQTLAFANRVSLYRQGQPYVIECFATWCGPCRQMIPHLAEMPAKYPHVYIISISKEDINTVSTMVRQTPPMQRYNVAVDRAGATERLMQSQGATGIPFACVFNAQGRPVYSGHPASPEFAQAVSVLNTVAGQAQGR